jgi:transposase
MPRPCSQDLRDRVVASVAGGRSRRAAAKTFSASVATVVRWSQRFQATGSAAALAMGGRRPHRLAGRREWLLARIADRPDLTLRALPAELAADGIKVSHGALRAFFAREGITFKKRACTPANRIAPTSPAGASGGGNIRAGLPPSGRSSSTRPGPGPP